MPTAVRCTVCGGATGVRGDAVRQRCEFCGSELVWQATHTAAGAAEQRVGAALARIEPELDALDRDAKQRAAAGDLAGAHQLVAEHVRRVGAIYAETGYYALLGLTTHDEIERYCGFAFRLQLQRLELEPAPSAPPVETPGQAQMIAAIAAQDLDGALAGYRAMLAHQLATDPAWRDRDPVELEQIRVSSTRAFALGLPWAPDEELRRHGIELAVPTVRADGSSTVTCVRCGAEVALARLAESVACAHCGATFRVRLTRLDAHHARGHAEVTAQDVAMQEAAEHVARDDLGGRITMAQQITADMAPAGSPRARELTFTYALEVGDALTAPARAALATRLGLGAPTSCRSCSATIALVPGGRTCPMCTAPL